MALTRPRAYQIYDIDYKQAVRVVTTSNITLTAGAPNTVDGVSLSVNDRVLVTGQSSGAQNGIYYVTTLGSGSNGTWTRSIDTDATGELLSGTIVMVTEGTAYADTQWKLTTNDPITIDVTALTFVQNYLANSISFGSTSFAIASSNANATISVSGVGNVAVFAPTGEYVTGLISANGNITGGNLTTAGQVSATGNITGNYILGNGSQLTGLPATYANANVAAYLASGTDTSNIITTANVSGGNVLATTIVSGASVLGSIVSASGNITGGNLLTGGLISAAGNITSAANISGGNVLATTTVSAASHIGSVVSASGNITGGNLLTGGLISATGNITSAANVSSGNVLATTTVSAASLLGSVVSASGNITGGNLITGGLLSTIGNLYVGTGNAGYVYGNATFMTGISAAISVSKIENGNSNVWVQTAGGDVTVTAGGISNVAVFSTGSLTLSGALGTPKTISANIVVAGNINAMLIGPLVFGNGVSLTVPNTSTVYVYSPNG